MAEPKTVILCFDGTTNEYGPNNTNVVKIYSMLAKDHPTKQVVYYQPGLGMYFDAGAVNPVVPFLFNIAQGFDWSFAWYLYQHVIDGYRFIMQNWNEGDKLYIFGFSRGAYTARCVAGMVQKIGVLPKDNEQSLAYAYGLYKRVDTEGIALASSYKRAFCRDVKTDFLGCFDTVASVGLIIARELPFTSNNAGVKRFRHALALDEHRFRFTYSAWKGPCPFPSFPKEVFGATPAVRIPASLSSSIAGLWWKLNHPIELYYQWEGTLDKIKAGQRPNIAQVLRPGVPLSLADLTPKIQNILTAGVPTTAAHKILEDDKCERPAEVSELHGSSQTDVKEVWFTGCHSDIGGCADADNVPRSLGDITLRWMVKELIQSGLPVEWNKGALEELYGDELDEALGKIPPTATSKLDAYDAKAPIHDDLKYPVWWTFELPPLSWTWQDIKGNWYRQWRPNLARGRHVEGTPTLHRSVRMRMADPSMRYKPRANIQGPPAWES